METLEIFVLLIKLLKIIEINCSLNLKLIKNNLKMDDLKNIVIQNLE